MNQQELKPFTKFAMNLVVVIVFIVALSGTLEFTWDYVVAWIFPTIKMSYWNAVGIITFLTVVHMYVNFWINKYKIIKSQQEILKNYSDIVINIKDFKDNKDLNNDAH